MQSLLIFFSITGVLSVSLPSNFRKCDRNKPDFNECLSKAVENSLSQMTKPFPNIGLIKMEPLEIPELTVGAGTGPVQFVQNYQNLKITGFAKTQCNRINMDFMKKQMLLDCTIPEAQMDFIGEVTGKILLLAISGKGPGVVLLNDLHFDVVFDFEEYERNGKKYFKIKSSSVKLSAKKVHLKLATPFTGDKKLSDTLEKMINDNWEDVFNDIKKGYEEVFGKVFTSVSDHLLEKISIQELFDGN